MQNILLRRIAVGVFACVTLFGVLFSLPTLLAHTVEYERQQRFSAMQEDFPVTVNPQTKTIAENKHVNEYLEGAASPLQAAVGNAESIFARIFRWIAVAIADAPWYSALAATDSRFVEIQPGMRKEQVAATFGKVLGWTATEKKEFLTTSAYASLPLTEGSYQPGVYVLSQSTSPRVAQALVNDRFVEEILSRYSSTTASLVPLEHALTIASLIEREAGGADDMRLISGIIWNRLFIGMNLQIDATLQYAKANAASAGNWWPGVVPADRFRKSAYNTYQNAGLPPAPIANPSVASVLAALNPKNTSCYFYFHDAAGGFHCSNTYAEHVKTLKQYYGRGK
jgi:cell division protein YceG involved in septum cleavage